MSNREITLEYNGISRVLQIPLNHTYRECYYDEDESAKFVHLNLPENKKELISELLISCLLHFQNIYTEANEFIDEVLFTCNEINMEFLNNRTGFLKEISKEDVIMIFGIEKYYYKYLGIIP